MKELEELAGRKGFYLTVLDENDKDFARKMPSETKDADKLQGSKFVLEDVDDEEAEFAYFKTEIALRAFLEAFSDKG